MASGRFGGPSLSPVFWHAANSSGLFSDAAVDFIARSGFASATLEKSQGLDGPGNTTTFAEGRILAAARQLKAVNPDLPVQGGSSSAEVIIERISKILSNFSELYFYDASSFAMSKRGRRDLASLKLNSVDLRREDYSQKSHFYASRQRGFSTPPKVRRVFRSDRPSPRSPRSHILTPPTRGRFTGDAAARQRVSIQHLFQDVFGSPP